jgi:hypothetical protein
MPSEIHEVTVRQWDRKRAVWEDVTVRTRIEVDIAGIARKIAGQAAGNKSGKASFMGGLVTATTIQVIKGA